MKVKAIVAVLCGAMFVSVTMNVSAINSFTKEEPATQKAADIPAEGREPLKINEVNESEVQQQTLDSRTSNDLGKSTPQEAAVKANKLANEVKNFSTTSTEDFPKNADGSYDLTKINNISDLKDIQSQLEDQVSAEANELRGNYGRAASKYGVGKRSPVNSVNVEKLNTLDSDYPVNDKADTVDALKTNINNYQSRLKALQETNSELDDNVYNHQIVKGNLKSTPPTKASDTSSDVKTSSIKARLSAIKDKIFGNKSTGTVKSGDDVTEGGSSAVKSSDDVTGGGSSAVKFNDNVTEYDSSGLIEQNKAASSSITSRIKAKFSAIKNKIFGNKSTGTVKSSDNDSDAAFDQATSDSQIRPRTTAVSSSDAKIAENLKAKAAALQSTENNLTETAKSTQEAKTLTGENAADEQQAEASDSDTSSAASDDDADAGDF